MMMNVTASLGHGVRWAGAQRDVLGGDISGRVDLAELAAIPDLYGLGPLEGVRGEVTILTPKDSNVHAHARTADRSVSGHVETIRLTPGARIAVPTTGWIQ
jgi:hypothetical protein